MHSYCLAGLSVDSEIAVPGLISIKRDEESHDITIRRGTVPLELDQATRTGPTWSIAHNRFLLRIPGVARFLIADGRSILFEAEAQTPDRELAVFLAGSVVGILLHQRGHIVLHASAVRIEDRAVLFCGASGAGKSTLAAALSQRGYPLVADDICTFGLTAGEMPQVLPDGRQLKLWSQAIDRLSLNGSRGQKVRNPIEKYYVEPDAVFSEALPLGAIYVLREVRPPIVAGIARPNVVDAALLLRRNAYRPLLVRQMDQTRSYFQAATVIANHAGIYHLSRVLDFAAMPQVIRGLEQHWAETGLVPVAA